MLLTFQKDTERVAAAGTLAIFDKNARSLAGFGRKIELSGLRKV